MRTVSVTLLGFFCLSGAALAATPFTIIEGDPLTIHVGADNAFQVFNADVPGKGQIFPSACETVADMGVFADINGTLFAPDFGNHGCGSATSNLGQRTPWTEVLLTDVAGQGTFESPFTVTVTTAAGTTGLRMVMTVQYVNGQNFFRIQKRLLAFNALTVRMWLAADIFLASSDFGIFHLEPSLNAPGGHDCASPPTYTILLIPVSSADKVTTNVYSEVWQEIGQGDLINQVIPGDCVDNGAAVQWDRSMAAGAQLTIRSAVSFGTIPSPANFARFSVTASPNEFTVDPGTTITTTLTTRRHDEGFNSELTLSADDLPPGFTATITPTRIGAPGEGTSQLSLQVSQDVLPGRHVIRIFVSGEGEKWPGVIIVNVACDPPFILGLDEPADQTVTSGSTARLRVTPSGSGPFRYQWFFGPRGSTFFPVEGATGAELTTAAIRTPTFFWVRVSNSCGSVDSRTVLVNAR